MGSMQAIGDCVRCGQMFSFNPERVPSVRVNGIREPLCRACVDWANPIRRARGLPEIPVVPGAYEPQECS